jgi:hypothetical protein
MTREFYSAGEGGRILPAGQDPYGDPAEAVVGSSTGSPDGLGTWRP